MSEKIIVQNKIGNIITVVSCILLIGLFIVGYFVYKGMKDDNLKLRTEVTDFKQLTDSLVRSSTKWATKDDLKAQMKDMLSQEDLKAIQKDMAKIDSRLTAVGRLIGSIDKRIAVLEESDSEGPDNPDPTTCDDGTGRLVDTYEYTKNPQIKELEDSNLAPVAKVQFNAASDKPWDYEVYKRNFKLVTVVGKEDSGQLTFHHKLEYTVPDKDPNKTYNINILSSDYLQVPQKNKMFWLNPVLDVDFFCGGLVYGFASGPGRADTILSTGVDVGLSLSSYGETKADSLFRFFRLGVGYDAERRAGRLSVAPLLYNVGKPLPLLTNLYLAPMVAVDTAGGLTVNLGLGLQL